MSKYHNYYLSVTKLFVSFAKPVDVGFISRNNGPENVKEAIIQANTIFTIKTGKTFPQGKHKFVFA